MKRERVKVTLDEGQSYVVADREIWHSIIEVLEQVAVQWPINSQERSAWLLLREDFANQVSDNLFMTEEEYDD